MNIYKKTSKTTTKNEGEKMTNKEMMQVANTIRTQIHFEVIMCAAARNFAAFENKEGLYGIQFNISNTSKFKFATVRITLNGCDLYDIEIKNIRGRIVESKKDIYCDQLSSILEGMWEKKEITNKWTPKELQYA